MRPFIFCLLFLFSTYAFAQKKLVILGDSLTEGYGVAREAAYPFLLEQIFKENKLPWTVINAGVSGSTTASALSRLKWLIKNQPDAVLIVLGSNDGLRGIKTAESEKNLAAAIEFLREKKIKVLLGGLYMPPNYGAEYTQSFQKLYSRLAKKFNIPLVPFILEKVAGRAELNQSDGIHPNEKGHKIIAEQMYLNLKDLL